MTRSRATISGTMLACGLALLIADRDKPTQAFAGRITAPLAVGHAEATVRLLRETGMPATQRDGRVVRDHRFAYEIDTGCLNLPLVLLLVIAVAMSPAPLQWRGLGIATAVLLLVGLNLLRLVHLFHLGAGNPAAFRRAHDVGWPGMLVAATLLFWFTWRRVTLVAALALLVALPSRSAAQPAPAARPTYADAVANDAAYRRLLQMLPRQGTFYVLDGDVRLTESEIRPFLSTLVGRQGRASDSSELAVNLHDGALDYWREPSTRRLTYAVDRRGFTDDEYERLVGHMKRATKEWVQSCADCAIDFVHRAELDSGPPTHEQVVFIVRKQAMPGFIALAFFPHDPPHRRYVDIDAKFFTTSYDPAGVLRHELGHVLGYRHEHARVDGCGYDPENQQWMALTPYDSTSVMHYPCEGVTQAGHTQFLISEGDVAGHRALYGRGGTARNGGGEEGRGLAASDARGPRGTLVIQLEGGEVTANAARVVRVLADAKLIRFGTHVADGRESLCGIYDRNAKFPGACSQDIAKLAADVNNLPPNRIPRKGQEVHYPVLEFEPYPYRVRLDPDVGSESKQMRDIDTHWKSKILNKTQTRDGSWEVTLQGYRIEVPSLSEKQATEARRAFRGPNVVCFFRPDEARAKALYGTRGVHDYYRDCLNGMTTNGDQGAYTALLTAETIPECARSCTGANCPEVVLVDTQVNANPDIVGALVRDDAAVAPPAALTSRCTDVPFVAAQHHGTHLAGIIAAQDNGFGFIGVNPGARLRAFDWQSANEGSLAEIIERLSSLPHVFVFASKWPFQDHEVDGSHLKNEDFRFRPLPSKRIKEEQPLWITAAGQWDRNADRDGRPILIEKDSALAPMNLGDLRNVIVVTACEDCTDETARLMADANFSGPDRLVHVAAPGGSMPGLATADSCASAGGTSQAVAFVGGLASSMLSCFPNAYTKPEQVKTRLQVTSRPVLSGADADKIAAGIVDPALALLDPAKAFIKPAEAAAPVRWCVPEFQLRDAVNRLPVDGWYARAEDVYRIVRYRGAGATQDPMQWVIYKRKGYDRDRQHVGEVFRIGPGIWSGPPVLKLVDGKVVRLENVEDILLPATLPAPADPC